tara:strand:- start:4833 stop:5048 length:216 start_codon:yes stop_codon:yes gene_type:complete
MQKVQDQLEFNVEIPSDSELAKRFAERQRGLSEQVQGLSTYAMNQAKKKTRNRKSKKQKKQERMNRDKEAC